MSAVWGLFSRDPIKEFPYEVVSVTHDDTSTSPWILHSARKRASPNEEYSIFAIRSERDVEMAKSTARRLKSLRHPCLLTFVDSLETDKVVYIVTEKVVPVRDYLDNLQLTAERRLHLMSWGIFQITNALRFLCDDCKLSHNFLSIHALFVNSSGEWKLGGLDQVCEHGGNSPFHRGLSHELRFYEPPNAGRAGKPWSRDSFMLGATIWEVFNGNLASSEDLKRPKKIPQNLHKPYAGLISPDPLKRCSPSKFLELCREPHGFMRNNFVNSLVFLDEIQIKDPREKSHFFHQLHESLDEFPDDIAKNKILPLLINAYEYGDAGSSVLPPIFKLGRLLDEEQYQKRVVPCVIKLFSSTDRSTRFKLLEQIELFVPHLQPAVVDKIFPNVVSGFMDTNPAVREATVKAMIFVAPKLNYNNLNVELMKHLARLQGRDDQPGIRTNTTIALGKIAPYLHHQNRPKILISAFTRAFKDPFAPARSAGVMALMATQQFYGLEDGAVRILPALTPLLLDPEKSVRDAAFKATKGFVEKLEKVSENPELKVEMEAHVQSSSTSGNLAGQTASWAGWAMGAIGAKFYKSPAPTAAASGTPKESMPSGSNTKQSPVPAMSSQPARPVAPHVEPVTEGWGDIDDAEDWGEMDEPSTSKPVATGSTRVDSGWDDDEEDWGSLEVNATVTSPEPEPVKPSPPRQSSKSVVPSKPALDDRWGNPDDDAWLAEIVGKPSSASSPLSGGSAGLSLADRNAKKRQEMAQRRQAGPMKLGAKKM